MFDNEKFIEGMNKEIDKKRKNKNYGREENAKA